MRRLFLALSLILHASAGAAAAQPQGAVLLNSNVVVEGPMLHLGDLFDGLGERAATPVARAPEPGHRSRVDARWLAAVAQAYGVPWRPSSQLDHAIIERASMVIDTRRIEDTALDALRARGVRGRIALVLDNPALRLHLPSDAAPTLLVTGMSHDPETGRFTAHVVAPAEGRPLARATLSGRAVEMVEVPTLRRRMEPDEVIGSADIEWRERRADRLPRNAVRDAAAVLGKAPRRPLRAGDPILASELRAPIVVAKNSLVTIRLRTARMTLTAQGRAMEAGARDDVIRVVNTKSKKIINASVIDSGTVGVVPSDLRAAE